MATQPEIKTWKWSAQEDATLRSQIGKGLSFGKTARIIGRSRNACIGRYRRLEGARPGPLSTYPKDHAAMLALAVKVEAQSDDADTVKLADWVKQILLDEMAS